MQELTAGDAVCIVNIGKVGRQRRMLLGVAGLATGAALAAALAATGASTVARLLPFLLFANGAAGVWQALDKT